MRYMMVMIPNIPADADWSPPKEAVERMTRYNEELTKAGVLLALDGLRPPSEGARVSFGPTPGAKPSVTDGPFTEAKEVIGGYWLIQARSKEEALEWATRIPGNPGDVVEVRRVAELSDFDSEVAAAAELSAVPPEQTFAS
jgi:hypothetical protein